MLAAWSELDVRRPVALVTGGSRGIGRAIVLALAGAGARVAFTFHRGREAADALCAEAASQGLDVQAVQADASSYDDAQRVAAEVGPPSILVNNAGVAHDGVIWKMSEAAWDEVIDLNLKGCFNYVRAVTPSMREERDGRIVSITSINALRGKFGQGNYTASKAGIIGLTKTVAREMGRYGVNVNAVAPGLIETEMADAMPAEVRQQSLDGTVLGRLGPPGDVAPAVLFLCSRAARHITGEVLKVDGGQYL